MTTPTLPPATADAPTAGSSPPRRTGWQTTLVVVGLVLAVVGVAEGTVSVAGMLAYDTERLAQTYDGVQSVDVESGAGTVTVTGTDGDRTSVQTRLAWSLRKPRLSARLVDGTLRVRVGCPYPNGPRCTTTVRVDVPAGTVVRVHSSGGPVRVRGVNGDVTASSSGGGVSAVDTEGSLDLSSSGGGVTGEGLRSAQVRAGSSGGGVRLVFAAAPTRVYADSSGGGVRVVVPDTDDAYRVDAASSGGSTRSEVRTDPGSPRVIRVRSSGGGVRVTYPD